MDSDWMDSSDSEYLLGRYLGLWVYGTELEADSC